VAALWLRCTGFKVPIGYRHYPNKEMASLAFRLILKHLFWVRSSGDYGRILLEDFFQIDTASEILRLFLHLHV
jgi:hypothetical protein